MQFFDTLKARFSVRAYSDRPVEPEKLVQVLEAARLAPTAANKQPFKLVVFKTADRSETLKRVYHRPFFVQAPLVIGVFASVTEAWTRGDGMNYGDVDATIAMDHLILAATDLGLGTCWVANFNAQAAGEAAGLGPDYKPVAFTPLGYPDASAPERKRKALDDLVVYR